MYDFDKIYLVLYKDMWREYRAVIGNIDYVSKITDRHKTTIINAIKKPTYNCVSEVIGLSNKSDLIQRNFNIHIDGQNIEELVKRRIKNEKDI